MTDKQKYIERFKQIYLQKNGQELPEDLAYEYFESLIALVGAITSHVEPKEIISSKV